MLRDEVKVIAGRKREFFLLCVSGVDRDEARKLVKIPKGTYNEWFKDRPRNTAFKELYRKIKDFPPEYEREAIQLLRRTNQRQAYLIEKEMLKKIMQEVLSGRYDLLRTLAGRDVLNKLLSTLDYQPQTLALSWEQRLQSIYTGQPQIPEGDVVDGTAVSETIDSVKIKYQESQSQPNSEQEPGQSEEAVQD